MTPESRKLSPETAERLIDALNLAFPGIDPTEALAQLLEEHAARLTQAVRRRLTTSDLARLEAALLGAALRDRASAAGESVPSVAAQLEHQANHAAALAADLAAAADVLLVVPAVEGRAAGAVL